MFSLTFSFCIQPTHICTKNKKQRIEKKKKKTSLKQENFKGKKKNKPWKPHSEQKAVSEDSAMSSAK